MACRLFSPRSARQTLLDLEPTVQRVCRLFRSLEANHPGPATPEQRVDPSYFEMVLRMHRLLLAIHRHGVRVVDPRVGRLDFPARRDGREVLLRWRAGETALTWHIPGRDAEEQPAIDEDGPWEEA